MKHSNTMSVSLRLLSLAVIVVSAGLPESTYAMTDEPLLLLQQSPPDGGTVTPDVGLHEFALGTDVTLTAVARPGYQFVCWIGDVTDPTKNKTVVHLDAPKIVIAVYERDEFELLTPSMSAVSASLGGAFISSGDYARTGYTGGGARRPSRPSVRRYHFEPPEPGPEPEVPVPTPEPATIMLLGFGALILVNRKRPR